MNIFTYRSLLAALQNMSENELDMTATVWLRNTDEYMAVSGGSPIIRPDSGGILDDDHPVMGIDF